MRIARILLVGSIVLTAGGAAWAANLGIASDFNAFIFEDLTATGGDTEGRLAVGDDLTASFYSVGFHLAQSFGTRDDLIVGGDLDAVGGWQVPYGNAVYGGSLIHAPTHLPPNTTRYGSLIDFEAARDELATASAFWASLSANGSADYQYGTLTLTGTDDTLNVFDVDPTSWALAHTRIIDAPAGSTVLLNIAGASGSMSGGLFLDGGVTAESVLYNFHESTSLNANSIAVLGSVLAPHAHLRLSGGHINGVTVVRSAETFGGGEFHDFGFAGDLPPVPEPGTLALLCLGALFLTRR